MGSKIADTRSGRAPDRALHLSNLEKYILTILRSYEAALHAVEGRPQPQRSPQEVEWLREPGLWGLRIQEELEKCGLEVASGSLYGALYKLEANGYIKARWGEDRPGNRRGARRRLYRLEPSGAESLEVHLDAEGERMQRLSTLFAQPGSGAEAASDLRVDTVTVPDICPYIIGMTLEEASRLTGASVRAVLRAGGPVDPLPPETRLLRGDSLELAGNSRELADFHRLLEGKLAVEQVTAWVALPDACPLVGKTLAEADIRNRTRATVLAIRREGKLLEYPTPRTRLLAGDCLEIMGTPFALAGFRKLLDREAEVTRVDERLRLPDDCFLVGKTLAEAGVRTHTGITVLCVERKGRPLLERPISRARLLGGDCLEVVGTPLALAGFRKLLSAQSRVADGCCRELTAACPLVGMTLAEADIRSRTGATVVAIERGGAFMECPTAETRLLQGDIVHLEGSPAALHAFHGWWGAMAHNIAR
ncbi:TrkA C-terminal domain-containing protein [Gloeobacter violaceus]|uniref:Glr3459 protein n=1 Tax=Gloeobacter violaceus (strain ATCC 29082 / PCC 7421) TaxID=251221 RepID=Q7NFR5_GLOVI|nr:TrkA C-terminal domain-containing protein [Gloeobacter violaceus]BAC91400.1 glr3459 [Gloeobacter violaceus PCC 7421]